MKSKTTAVSGMLALCFACGGPGLLDVDATDAPITVPLSVEEKAGVLALVNDCAITAPVLDIDAALDRRAANNIVSHRDGSDARCATADDDLFGDLPELDAISYVGDTALQRLLDFAVARGYLSPGGSLAYFDGVGFDADEMAAVLDIANTASQAALDDEVGLDARAAANIVAARPFDDPDPVVNMEQLAAVSYVGASALERLKAYIPSWSGGCAPLGGSFEGVIFTDLQAHDVLDLCNQGNNSDLDKISGIGPALAAAITSARPFSTVTDIGAVSGIGPSVLTKLRDQTPALWCVSVAAACGCEGEVPPVPVEQVHTFDGVDFTDSEVQSTLAALNTATRAQLRADAKLSKGVVNVIEAGRTWTGLGDFAATSGIGGVAMGALLTYVQSGMWTGPGPMQTAITVHEVVARAAELNGRFVSFNRVLAVSARINGIFEATLKDADGDTVSVDVWQQLCNPYTDNCVAAPAIHTGEEVELVHVKVDLYYGRLTLRPVDTTEVGQLGCWEGFARACGKDVGVCSVGEESCVDDTWSSCSGMVDQLDSDPPDGLDNDCDGRVDENSFELQELGHLEGVIRAVGPRGDDSLAATETEMLRLDLSEPTQIQILERAVHSDVGRPRFKVQADRTVMSACRSGTRIYPVPASGLEPLMSLPPTITASTVGCIQDAWQQGDRLYTADWYNGVFGYDLSGTEPVQVLHIPLSFPRALALRGQYLIVLSDDLRIYDLADPSAPVQGPFHGGRDMAVSDDGMIAVGDYTGIYLFDASNPAQVTAFPVMSGIKPWHLDFDGDLLVAAPGGSDRTLYVVDTSNPGATKVVSEVDVPNPSGVISNSALQGVVAQDGLIYAFGGTGLHIFGIAP